MLRPRPTRWFEILAARDDATQVLEALARTGAVELEARASVGLPAALADIAPLLAPYSELAARYQAYWPPPEACRPAPFPQAPAATLQRSMASIRAWAAESEPLIQSLQHFDAERDQLVVWQRTLSALAKHPVDAAQLAAAGPWFRVRLLVLPPGVKPEQILPGEDDPLRPLASVVEIDGAAHLLVVGPGDALQHVAQAVATFKGRVLEVPRWLDADAGINQAQIEVRLAAIGQGTSAAQEVLAELQERHDLARALGDANRLQWVLHNVHALETRGLLCWITGWSIEGIGLSQALESSGARALLRFAVPPEGATPPLLLSNPRWAQPFEIFSRALGMPSSDEADPSQLLAIVVPLLFGYMFGDVGQGLLLAVVAWFLRRRFPVARLLMVGGVSAAAFGLLFGSVFSLHGVLPAIWRQPLEAPLPVLMAPLAGGVALLTIGLGLDALAAAWRHEGWRWLIADAALPIVYLGLLAGFAVPAGFAVAAAGAIAFCLGHAVVERRAAAGLAAIGELIEKTLQLLINTLSFARVGAFALAHAGLSSAIVALMDAADSSVAKALILLLGNAIVIVLEAMVVSIQTTRLVLFEFFTRFMQGRGRAFRPLPAPPFVTQEN